MAIIVIEGLDGSGKTTLVNKLAERLNAIRMESLSFQNNLHIENILKNGAGNAEVHLYALKEIQRRIYEVVEKLGGKQDIVVDRYVYSAIAYYFALTYKGQSAVTKLESHKSGEVFTFPQPQLSLFLDYYDHGIRERRLRKKVQMDRIDYESCEQGFIDSANSVFGFFVREGQMIKMTCDNLSTNQIVDNALNLFHQSPRVTSLIEVYPASYL